MKSLNPPLPIWGSSLGHIELLLVLSMAVLEQQSRQMTNKNSNLFPVYVDKATMFFAGSF